MQRRRYGEFNADRSSIILKDSRVTGTSYVSHKQEFIPKKDMSKVPEKIRKMSIFEDGGLLQPPIGLRKAGNIKQ